MTATDHLTFVINAATAAMTRDTDDDWGALKAALWDASAFLREHQPRAAAPAPEAETGALRAELAECSGMLFALAQQIENERRKLRGDWTDWQVERISETAARARAALSATPTRPAMDPETRRVLEDVAAALSRLANDFHPAWHRKAGICKKHAEDIHAHLAAHGGENE
jgi:hypothetical protein